MAAKEPKKKQSIRNNEYYDTQECFDKPNMTRLNKLRELAGNCKIDNR